MSVAVVQAGGRGDEAVVCGVGRPDARRRLQRLSGVPAPQRDALEVALLEAEPGPRPPQRRALLAGFCSVLFELAADGVLLVAVDDLQWLDQPSQAALGFALRRLGRRPIGFACSLRTGERSGLTAGLAGALEESGAERVRLGPLSVGALHELLAGKLGRNLARPAVVRIAGAARGNPFYAVEVARELPGRGAEAFGDVLPVPEDLSSLVAARVRRLPRATRDALLVAAALSSPRLGLLDRAALDPAEATGLIEVGGEQVLFSHPLFAESIYGSASMPKRRELHRELAPLVGDPEDRARHLALGAEQPSEEIAIELEGAAERSVSRGAPDAAAELLELAVRLTPPGSERTQLRALAAANCHFHAGDRPRARSLAEQVLAGSPAGPVRGGALQVLGEVRYHEDSFREAVPLFEEALSLLRDDARAVEVHINLAYAHWNLGNMADAAVHAHAAAEAAGSVAPAGLVAAALAASALADFYLDRPLDRARLESALALEDPDQPVVIAMRPSLIVAVVEFFSDNLERAATLFAALRQRTLELGQEGNRMRLAAELSMLERTRGELGIALKFCNESYEIARMLGSTTAQALALAERCYVRASLGDVEGPRGDADLVLTMQQHTDVGFAAPWVHSAVAFLELSTGNAAAAHKSLESFAVLIERSGSTNPAASTMVLPDEIEALVALCELKRAEALAAMLERHGRRHDRGSVLARAARCRSLLAAANGDLPTAEREVEQALVQHARARMPLEHARTLLVKGQIERRCKQKRAARESFRQALEDFESIGARLWSQRARMELERTGVRHSEGDALSPTELRVAELAAAGLTNERIADSVFISAKTVEANLARVYRKMGIRSRAELGRAMAERHPAGSPTPADVRRG